MYIVRFLILIVTFHSWANNFTPEILSIEHQIAQLEIKSRLLTQMRREKLQITKHSSLDGLEKYTNQQNIFIEKCRFEGIGLQAYFFQTTANIYIAINRADTNNVQLYNTKCETVSVMSNLQIFQILCDRGICQSGLVYFISKDEHLYSIHEENSFQKPQMLSSLRSQSKIVGGVLRNRGKDKIQIYISEQKGSIKIFDEEGINKLRLELQGNNNNLMLITDHHPFPLLSTYSNWISMLDTAKYTEIAQNCPHIPNIRKLLSQNFYGETIYAITSEKIYVIHFDISKRICSIKRHYDLGTNLKAVDRASYFSNALYIDEKIYNLTEEKIYKFQGCQSRMSHDFISKKSQADQIYSLKQCCKGAKCQIFLFQLQKTSEERSAVFWITIVFVVILFISLTCIKRSAGNSELDDSASMRQRQIQNQINELTRISQKGKSKKK